jgi:hypothetical protein
MHTAIHKTHNLQYKISQDLPRNIQENWREVFLDITSVWVHFHLYESLRAGFVDLPENASKGDVGLTHACHICPRACTSPNVPRLISAASRLIVATRLDSALAGCSDVS